MDAYLDPVDVRVDHIVGALADRQHGLVSHEQLLELGLGRGAINRRLEAGRLLPVFRGVYAVGRRGLTADGRVMAAVLACGAGAAVSHISAAGLWGLVPDTSARTHITVPTRGGRASRPLIAVHRPRRPLADDERTVERGIPITTVARTLLDVADSARPQVLRRACEQAELLRLFDLQAVEAVTEAHPGRRRACARLRAALPRTDPALTRSELERRFLDLCRERGLAPPLVNAVVHGIEVDFFWPARGLVVETDGFEHHGTRSAFERDRQRDAHLTREGLRVLRFSFRQVVDEPATVLATVAAAAA